MLTMVFWFILALSLALLGGFLVWLVVQMIQSEATARYWAFYQNKYRHKPRLVRDVQAMIAITWRFFWGGFGANI